MIKRRENNLFEMLKEPEPSAEADAGDPPVRYRTIDEIQADAERRRKRVRRPFLFRRREEEAPSFSTTGTALVGSPEPQVAIRTEASSAIDFQEVSETVPEIEPVPDWAIWFNGELTLRRGVVVAAGVAAVVLMLFGISVGTYFGTGPGPSPESGDQDFKGRFIEGQVPFGPQIPAYVDSKPVTTNDQPILAPTPGGGPKPGDERTPPAAEIEKGFVVAFTTVPKNQAVIVEKVLDYVRRETSLPADLRETSNKKLQAFAGPFATREEADSARSQVSRLKPEEGVNFSGAVVYPYQK